MRDWRGTLINVGSTIIYPQRYSSSMWMVEAVVKEITEKEERGRTVPALRVQPFNATWTHSYSDKVVTLTALDRVTVVSPVKTTDPRATTLHMSELVEPLDPT